MRESRCAHMHWIGARGIRGRARTDMGARAVDAGFTPHVGHRRLGFQLRDLRAHSHAAAWETQRLPTDAKIEEERAAVAGIGAHLFAAQKHVMACPISIGPHGSTASGRARRRILSPISPHAAPQAQRTDCPTRTRARLSQ